MIADINQKEDYILKHYQNIFLQFKICPFEQFLQLPKIGFINFLLYKVVEGKTKHPLLTKEKKLHFKSQQETPKSRNYHAYFFRSPFFFRKSRGKNIT